MEAAENLLSRVNLDALIQVASSTIPNDQKCHFVSSTSEISSGYLIFIIEFSKNGQRWAARFPLDQEFPFSAFTVEPLHYIARNFPELPAPRVHSFSEPGHESSVGAAYMLLDWIKGLPLKPWSLDSPSIAIRYKVLDQLADFILQMALKDASKGISYYGVPDGTPPDTAVSTTTWLTESVDRGLRRTLNRNQPEMAISYLIQRSMVSRYVVDEHDKSPWVVVHGDLHNDNIIMDEDFNMQGVIDWDFTFAVPLQKAATYPKLIENVPGGAPPKIPEEVAYLNLSADKTYFLDIIAKKEMEKTGNSYIARLIDNSSERNFFEMSLHRAPVHEEFVKKFCARSPENIKAASNEMDSFLATNQTYSTGKTESAVQEIFKKLTKLKSDFQ